MVGSDCARGTWVVGFAAKHFAGKRVRTIYVYALIDKLFNRIANRYIGSSLFTESAWSAWQPAGCYGRTWVIAANHSSGHGGGVLGRVSESTVRNKVIGAKHCTW